MAGSSGVLCLNAVVWEVEDLCHRLPLDGPIVGVAGNRLCANTVIWRLRVVVFSFFVFFFFLKF